MSGDQFEDLTRKMARSTSRRGVLKGMGAAAAAGVAAAVLKPFRGDAITATCPTGTSKCGSACCDAGAPCANATKSCCCATGETACNNACCASGVACVDYANSVCGCPKGMTPCGTGTSLKCCQKGTACSPSNGTCQPVGNFSTTTKTCCRDRGAGCSSSGQCCSSVCISGVCS